MADAYDLVDDEPRPDEALAGLDQRPTVAGVEVPDEITLDVNGRLAEDIDCRACGYNLRGGDPQGTCPECGAAVGFSLVGDLLKFADPVWVRTLAAGSGWIIASVVVTIAVALLFIAVAIAAGGSGGDDVIQIMLLAMLLPLAVGLYGYWLVTTPEPTEREHPRPLRQWARWLAVVGSLLGAGMLMLLAIMFDQFDPMIYAAMSVLMLPLSIASTVTIMLWARTLALRVPDDKLADHTRVVMWGVVIHEVVDIFNEFVPVAGCLSAVLGLVFGIWAIVLMVQYRNRLAAAASAAERTWARQSARMSGRG